MAGIETRESPTAWTKCWCDLEKTGSKKSAIQKKRHLEKVGFRKSWGLEKVGI
jgi:hypothetical protein